MNQDKIGLAVGSLAVAVLLYVVTCSTANATPRQVNYQNPSATIAYDALDVCTAASCTRYAAACAPGATCQLTADLPPGSPEVWLLGRAAALVSAPSNRRTFVVLNPQGTCDASDVWRSDYNGDHSVTVSDFGRFLPTLGSSW